jgi:hypothetical protein
MIIHQSRSSSVGISVGYGLDDRGSSVLGFDSRRGMGIFLFTTGSRTVVGTTQPPIQWVPGALFLEVKRPRREADHSPPSSAEVKNAWSYTSTPQYVFMAWCLAKHRDNFTFNFMLIHQQHTCSIILCCCPLLALQGQRFNSY